MRRLVWACRRVGFPFGLCAEDIVVQDCASAAPCPRARERHHEQRQQGIDEGDWCQPDRVLSRHMCAAKACIHG